MLTIVRGGEARQRFVEHDRVGCVRQVQLADRAGVHRNRAADARRGAQQARAFRLLEHDQATGARGDQEERLAELDRRLLQHRTRALRERLALEHAEREAEQTGARTIATGVVLLDQLAPAQRGEQAMHAALGQRERAPDLADALRLGLRVQVEQHVEGFVDGGGLFHIVER